MQIPAPVNTLVLIDRKAIRTLAACLRRVAIAYGINLYADVRREILSQCMQYFITYLPLERIITEGIEPDRPYKLPVKVAIKIRKYSCRFESNNIYVRVHRSGYSDIDMDIYNRAITLEYGEIDSEDEENRKWLEDIGDIRLTCEIRWAKETHWYETVTSDGGEKCGPFRFIN